MWVNTARGTPDPELSLGTQAAWVRRDQDFGSIYLLQESPSSVSGHPQPKPLYYPISYAMF